MKTYDCPQLSDEWWALRRGRPTASEFHRVLTPAQGRPSAAQAGYIAELIEQQQDRWEPPVMSERFATPAMMHGRDCEHEARLAYEFETGTAVRRVGFVTTDDGRFGCSPDGLADGGGLELKCPEVKAHALYLMAGGLPDEYKCQVHGCLVVTGLPYWDFMSYCRGFDPLLVRVEPDEFTRKLKAELDVFFGKYLAALAKLRVKAREDMLCS